MILNDHNLSNSQRYIQFTLDLVCYFKYVECVQYYFVLGK